MRCLSEETWEGFKPADSPGGVIMDAAEIATVSKDATNPLIFKIHIVYILISSEKKNYCLLDWEKTAGLENEELRFQKWSPWTYS